MERAANEPCPSNMTTEDVAYNILCNTCLSSTFSINEQFNFFTFQLLASPQLTSLRVVIHFYSFFN